MASGLQGLRNVLRSGLSLPVSENMPVGSAVSAANDDGDEDPTGGRGYSIEKLKRQYRDFIGAKYDENIEAKEAERYYHAAQWTDEEIATLGKRGQPVVTYNRVGRKIDGVVGLVERLRQDPKAYPRNPGVAEEASELATTCLNYVLDTGKWRDLSPEAARRCSIRGIGGCELVVVPGDNGDPDVSLEEVDPREYFYDPTSKRLDFSDANFEGVSKWVDADEAAEQWPDAAEDLEAAVTGSGGEGDFLDEREIRWTNVSKKRVRIVEHWYKRGGEWFYCIYSGDIKLEEGVSPFVDERGRTCSKYLMFSCQVDHDNDRYGFVRNLKGPQDEVNHRRSKGLHALNTRRITYTEGVVDDIEHTRREVAKADGVVKLNPIQADARFEVDSPATDFEGNIALLAEAKAELENFGPNPALIGTGVQNQSGRAIALLQQAGIAELGPFILAYRGWKMRVYRAVWNALKQFWTAERWIRVTDAEGLAQFVQVNGWERDEYGRPVAINSLGALDVDIILDEGPDNINSMADAFDTLMAMAQSGADVPPAVIIELSQLPASVKKRVMGHLQEKQMNPQEAEAVQVRMAQEVGKAQKVTAEAALAAAKAAEVGAKTQKTGAETEGKQIENAGNALALSPFTGLVPPGPVEQSFMGQGPGVDPAMPVPSAPPGF